MDLDEIFFVCIGLNDRNLVFINLDLEFCKFMSCTITIVCIKNTDDVRAILDEIQRAGLALPGLDVRKPNLEAVFLKLTSAPPDDRENAGAA